MGHIARSCKEERSLIERVEVKCVNCSAVGHRARDCPEPRRDQFACRNCGYDTTPLPVLTSIHWMCTSSIRLLITRRSPEHKASECPNPRTSDGVECRRCNEGKQAGRHPIPMPCILLDCWILTFSSRALCQGLSAGQCAASLPQLWVSSRRLVGGRYDRG